RSRLARAGLRLAEHVPSGEQRRNRRLLNRRRRLVADGPDGGENGLAQTEAIEGRKGGGRGHGGRDDPRTRLAAQRLRVSPSAKSVFQRKRREVRVGVVMVRVLVAL